MPDAVPHTDYYDLTSITQLALAPDGERLAFVTTAFDRDEDEPRRSLFVAPTDGSAPPHRLTRASDARSPRFGPTGTKLAFLAARDEDVELAVSSDSDDENGSEGGDRSSDDGNETDAGDQGTDDGPETQLWMFDLERGGDAAQVTTLEEGVSAFDWAPDGERVVVATRDPTDDQREYLDRREDGGPIETERLQHKYDGSGWLDAVRTRLVVVDVRTRAATELEDAHDGGGLVVHRGGLQPRWSPAGDRIVFRSNRTETPDDNHVTDLYTITPDGDDLRQVTDSSLSASHPVWRADGERLAFVASDPDNWYTPAELYVTDFEESWSVTSDLDRTVSGAGPPRWLDADALLAAVGDEGRTRLVRASADGSGVERVFEAQGRDRAVQALEHASGTVAVVLAHPGNGHDVFAFETTDLRGSDSQPTRLTALNDDELERWETPRCERITYESDDGTPIDAVAYLPRSVDPDDPDVDPLPLVVSIHGGPASYDEPTFSFEHTCWTSRGYVVLKPNYRGSTSYGRDHCEVLKGAWNGLEVADILAGVDAVVDRGWADPERLFCTGFSYGGIATAYALAETDRFAAGAAEHGVYDMRSAFGTDDCHAWWESDYGLPWENPDGYAEASSIDDVDRIETPLLVTAGGEDWRCPPSQSEQLYVSLKKRGVPARLVVYPDEHHAIGDPDRAIHRLEELTDWFERFDPEAATRD